MVWKNIPKTSVSLYCATVGYINFIFNYLYNISQILLDNGIGHFSLFLVARIFYLQSNERLFPHTKIVLGEIKPWLNKETVTLILTVVIALAAVASLLVELLKGNTEPPPISQAKGPPPSESRVFVDIPPVELVNMLKGKMSSEQARIAAPFVGKWMRINEGFIDNVIINPDNKSGSVWIKASESVSLIFWFSKEWQSHLEVLQRGSKINIVGEIKKIEPYMIEFQDSEILQ
jgi:hypothetical protein